ncbi:PAS domain S-box protein [Algoriphagus marincola]|uniref:PAS domain S-box protein n=1 Tax=Algoriphagus marincola TaxID=264027 RepID=UPI00047A7419|nr:PAS domain S-box protein [Algoriphagus marincola]
MDLGFTDLQTYHVLDSGKDSLFDEITRMAAEVCGCSVGLIVLLEPERQWFKSSFGLDIKETPIKYSICKKVKEEQLDFLLVPDLNSDPELNDHPALKEFGVQFYAGFPLFSSGGNIMGTCCVIDFEPKVLNEFQLRNLRLLARQANNLLEIHKSNFQIRQEKIEIEKWRETVYKVADIAKVGALIIHYDQKSVILGDHTRELLLLPSDFSFDFDAYQSLNGNYQNSFEELISVVKKQLLTKGGNKGSLEYKLESKKRIFHLDYYKSAESLIIVFKEITQAVELQEDLRLYQSLMQELEKQSIIGAWEVDLEANTIFWTENTYKIYGLDSSVKLNLEFVKSFYPEESFKQMEEDFEKSIQTGKPYNSNYRFKSNNGQIKWVKVLGNPIKTDGKVQKIIGSIQDISEDMEVKNRLERANFLLEKRTQLLESLVNNNSFFIFRMTVSKEVIFMNQYYKTHFGFDQNYEGGDTADISVLDESSLLESEEMAKKAIQNPGEIFRSTLKQFTKQGKKIYCEWDVVFLGPKHSEGLLWIGQDVTHKIEQEQEIRKVSRLTSFLNAKLVEFNNITSHLFRGQISNLSGLYKLIELSDSPEEKNMFLDSFKLCLDRLEEIISELDTITNFEMSETGNIQPVELGILIKSIISKNFPYFNYGINEIEMNIPPDFLILTSLDYLSLSLNQIFSFAYNNRLRDLPFKLKISACQMENSIAKLEIISEFNQITNGLDDFSLTGFSELEVWKLKSARILLELIGGDLSLINDEKSKAVFKIFLPNAS